MDRTDIPFLVALALIVGGVAAIYWPVALIVAGALLWSLTVRYRAATPRGDA